MRSQLAIGAVAAGALLGVMLATTNFHDGHETEAEEFRDRNSSTQDVSSNKERANQPTGAPSSNTPQVLQVLTRTKAPNAELTPDDADDETPEDHDVDCPGPFAGYSLEPTMFAATDTFTVAPSRDQLGQRITHPRHISGQTIKYTQTALEAQIEGTMLVNCFITKRGEVTKCRVMKGLPFLDSTAVSTLMARRYTPARLDGRAVELEYAFKIRFTLPDE